VFTTAEDGQTSVEIVVLQGEREMAHDNKVLGKFTLANIPPAPRGMPQIEVTFDIDANGIVNVTAKDRGTGQEQKITITGTTALSDDEVDRMVKEAETHASEDQARKDEVEARNELDTLVYGTEKTVKDLGDKVPADTKSTVEAAVEDAKKALEGSDVDAIKAQTEKLREASYKLAEVVYSDQSDAEGATSPEGAAAQGEQASATDEEEVVDAEVVDDDK
jgi:molecular chaperone DnaK